MGVRTAIIGCGIVAAVWSTAIRADEPLPPPRPAGAPALPADAPKVPVPTAPPSVPIPGEPHTVRQPGFPSDAPPIKKPTTPYQGVEPFLPQMPFQPDGSIRPGNQVNLPTANRQLIRFSPRYNKLPNYVLDPIDKDTNRLIYTGGVIVNVIYLGGVGGQTPQEVEFATDNAVLWIKGAKGRNVTGGLDTAADADGKSNKIEVELYMHGNVVIRTFSPGLKGGYDQILRAEEIYYDVSKNKAVALCADMEMLGGGKPDPMHVRSPEVWRLGKNEWKLFDALTSSSKRPNDPGFWVKSREATLTQQETVRKNIFGIPYKTAEGEIDYGTERILSTRNSTIRVWDVPVWYFRRTENDINDPLGPLLGVGLGNDRIFGTQIYSTWDMYELIGRRHPPGQAWRLELDYLSDRGPAIGTKYDYAGPDFLGLGKQATGFLRGYLVNDGGIDQLGGFRPPDPPRPYNRDRLEWRHNQELYESGTTYVRLLHQIAYLSDQNFQEQYYKQEFDMGTNQETFAYLYGGRGNSFGSLWVEPNLARDWMTETQWLPRVDGDLIGQSLLYDRLLYTGRANAGWANFSPADVAPLPISPTDKTAMSLARLDLNQRLSALVDLGPFRLTPYGVVDLAYYSKTIEPAPPFGYVDMTSAYQTQAAGERGRFYGGGGASLSLPLSRLYAEAASELFNARGLYHKVNLSANYFTGYSDTPYYNLPQLDRLNDDATDQSYRNNRPQQSAMVPGAGGLALQNAAFFDPQQLAIRRLVDDRVDTLDTMQVVQLAANQRLQTKRGFVGNEHTVDWMALDLSISLFPAKNRDNYGEAWSFLEYNYLWNLGDRVSLFSAGWFDPFEEGARYFNLGMNFGRPDGSNLYVSYRHEDPVQSRALTGILSYQLSQKYGVNVGASYDFGLNEALSNTFSLTRTGADATVLVGVTYNALVNNLGFQFAIVPNVLGAAQGGRLTGFGSGNSGGGR